MLLNYLKLAVRLLIRNPYFTFINALGLSVGLAVFLSLWQYSQNELKSDRFYKDASRMMRVGLVWEWTDDNVNWTTTKFGTLWPEIIVRLAHDFPEIEDYTRVFHQENFTPEHIPAHGKILTLQYLGGHREKVVSYETGVVYADANLFQFFDFPLVKGHPASVLKLANSVVLSESASRKYFGNEDPVGKALLLNNEIPLTITGILRDLPKNSHFDFSIVISAEGIQKYINHPSTSRSGPYCYVRLKEHASPEKLQQKLNKLSAFYLQEKVPLNEKHMVRPGFHLASISDISFNNVMDDYFPPKSKSFLKTLGVISVAVLLMAWVNYTNLALSANLKRMKEFALRRTCGAKLRDVVVQFTLESLLMNALALILALTFIQIAGPVINRTVGFYIPAWDNITFPVIAVPIAIFALGAFVTGVVPGLILARKTPRTLITVWNIDSKTSIGKSILLVFQFSVATVLIVWIFAMYLQLNSIMSANIGLERHQVLIVDLPVHRTTNFEEDADVLLSEIKRLGPIDEATIYTFIAGDPNAGYTNICLKRTQASNTVCVETNGGVDENFIPFFNIKMLAGKNFTSNTPANGSQVILSRRALERIGITRVEEAIGLKILVNQNHWASEQYAEAEVIGVVEDYRNRSLFSKNESLYGIILTFKHHFVKQSKPHRVAFRAKNGQVEKAISSVKEVFKSTFPGELCPWYFLDNHINRLYAGENMSRNQILLLTSIAIGIACLGLLGMVQYRVFQKTKEVGIRKVLGARFYHLSALLLKGTIKQVVVSTIVALPTAIYLTDEYLQKFHPRIDMKVWHYLLPVAALLVVMFGTIASLLWKAARRNPVDALRYE